MEARPSPQRRPKGSLSGKVREALRVCAPPALGLLGITGCSESPPARASAPSPPVEVVVRAPEAKPQEAAASQDLPAIALAPKKPPSASEPKPAPTGGARIYSKARFAWIYPSPKRSDAWLGYVSLGGSVPLKGGSAETARILGGKGCDAWYVVEPRGFMCAGSAATLDPNDPVVVALSRDAADVSSPWPFKYGESIGAPRYPRLPTREQQRSTEWDLDEHLELVAKAKAAPDPETVAAISKDLVGIDFSPAGQAPPELLDFGPLIREGRKSIAKASTIAFTREFDVDGRTFLQTADHAFIPKDRVKPYPRSDFQGIELGGDVALPIAFFRRRERPKFKRAESGELVASGENWSARSWVALTGEEIKQGDKTFFATREPGIFASADDATVVRAVTEAPFLRAGADAAERGRATWLDISVLGGWLVAYEGLKPVFVTLISPGRGGIPKPGVDPLSTASTPVGRFRIDGKFKTATMVSSTDENVVHTEVQFIQNFSGPHALHAAYWHASWGDPKSGGCVNLSPIDARRLFEWSEPRVPEGWHGLRATKDFGLSTEVVLHR